MSQSNALDSLIAALPGPILIVGASGFIGANLFHRIRQVREDVYGTLEGGASWRLKDIPVQHVLYLDVQDAVGVIEILEKVAPRVIFYCAAYGAYSFQSEEDRIYQTNFLALTDFLRALTDRPLAAFIHAGSSSEYGLNCTAPQEDAPRVPNSPYAVAKSAASDLIAYYGKVRDLPCINLRLYSVYGPYEDSTRLIPTLIEHGLRGELPPFVAPETSRDFIHVDDVVAAFCAAAQRMSPSLHGESYNICTGRALTIREVSDLARKTFSIAAEPSFQIMAARRWDLGAWYGNPQKAQQDLGWKPHTDFETGLVETTQWWQRYLTENKFTELTVRGRVRDERNSLTAVIACYKDAEAIPIMHRRLTDTLLRLKIDYEIIFVNDCSPDDSAEIIRKISLEDPRVTGITHSRNFGSQAAFRSGMELSTREACVLLDGDLQDPPELIEQFVEKWREGYDVVYGRRVKREMGLLQESMYKAFYRIFSSISNIPIPRDAGDFSLMDRTVVRWILNCGERDSFLRGLRAFVGFRQTGIDYVRSKRLFGRSTNNWLANFGWAKKAIFSFSNVPLELFTFAGITLFGITILLASAVFLLKLFVPHLSPTGVTTLLLGVMFFGSINLLGIAIIGEYIGKIIQEVKGRPPFIRRHLISGGRFHSPPNESLERAWRDHAE